MRDFVTDARPAGITAELRLARLSRDHSVCKDTLLPITLAAHINWEVTIITAFIVGETSQSVWTEAKRQGRKVRQASRGQADRRAGVSRNRSRAETSELWGGDQPRQASCHRPPGMHGHCTYAHAHVCTRHHELTLPTGTHAPLRHTHLVRYTHTHRPSHTGTPQEPRPCSEACVPCPPYRCLCLTKQVWGQSQGLGKAAPLQTPPLPLSQKPPARAPAAGQEHHLAAPALLTWPLLPTPWGRGQEGPEPWPQPPRALRLSHPAGLHAALHRSCPPWAQLPHPATPGRGCQTAARPGYQSTPILALPQAAGLRPCRLQAPWQQPWGSWGSEAAGPCHE